MRDEPTAALGVALSPPASQLPTNRAHAIQLGSKEYFTAKPCKHGHISRRYSNTGTCVDCTRVYAAGYAAKYPEKIRLRDKLYRESNKEKCDIRSANYRAANRLECAARAREWRAKNPEKVKELYGRSRARKARAAGSYSAEDVRSLYKHQHGKCAYFSKCGAHLKFGYHVDHIVAVTRGGTNFKSNLQLLCPRCNRRKSAKDPLIFAQEIGFLL